MSDHNKTHLEQVKTPNPDTRERPKASLPEIKDDLDFQNEYLSENEWIRENLMNNTENENLWRNEYETYIDQKEAKKQVRSFMRAELEKKIKMGFEEEQIEEIYKKLDEEIDLLAHGTKEERDKIKKGEKIEEKDRVSNRSKLSTFVKDMREHDERAKELHKKEAELDELRKKEIPFSDEEAALKQLNDFKKYLQLKAKKKWFLPKNQELIDLENKISNPAGNIGVSLDKVKKRHDAYKAYFDKLTEHQKLFDEVEKNNIPMYVFGKYELGSAAFEMVRQQFQVVQDKIFKPSEKDIKEHKQKQQNTDTESSVNTATETAILFQKLLKDTSLNLNPDIQKTMEDLFARLDKFQAAPKKGKTLSDIEYGEYRKIMEDVEKFGKLNGIWDLSEESKRIGEKVNKIFTFNNEENKDPKKEDELSDRKKSEIGRYFDNVERMKQYYEERKKTLKEAGFKEEYAVDLLKGVELYLDHARGAIKDMVELRLDEMTREFSKKSNDAKKGNEKGERDFVNKANAEKFLKTLVEAVDVVGGKNKEARELARQAVLRQLEVLEKDSNLGNRQMFIHTILEKFRSLNLNKTDN